MTHEEASQLLGAYIDGELDLAACVRIEEHIAGCAECQERLAGVQEVIEAVRDQAPRFEAPAYLKTRIRATLRQEGGGARPFWGRLPWLLAGGAVALAAIALAVVDVVPRGTPEVIRDAIADHVRSLQVNHMMDVASTDQHTVKPWFAGKLDFSPQVIDLSASGYPLIGGRLDVLDHRNVAALIYQRRKHYINLFIWPSDGKPLAARLYFRDGYHALCWTKSGMDYAAVSELGEAEFRDFVKMIQDQTIDTRQGE